MKGCLAPLFNFDLNELLIENFNFDLNELLIENFNLNYFIKMLPFEIAYE